jgi:aspartate/methionine/tyrosine aminotransferase
MRLANRTDKLTESVTLVITARAKELAAQGVQVVNLSVGEPDFPTPDPINRAGIRAIEEGFTRYTAGAGIPELRDAIVEKLRRDNNLSCERSQVVVSCGAKHALATSLLATVNPGDRVLYPQPGWLSYPELIHIAGGEPVPYPCPAEQDFRPDREALEELLGEAAAAIIVNSPNNPTGAACTPDEIGEIGALLARHDLWVISDEIYEKLRYDGQAHRSFADVPGLEEKTITINGVSKAYSMTGWRIGYLAAPPELARAAVKLQSQMTSSPCSISQKAALEALTGDSAAPEEMVAAFARRRDLVMELLNDIPHVTCPVPQGAFYAFPDISAYLGRTTGEGEVLEDSVALCEHLLNEAHVALVPGDAFGAPGHIRISFASSEENLREGLARTAETLSGLR